MTWKALLTLSTFLLIVSGEESKNVLILNSLDAQGLTAAYNFKRLLDPVFLRNTVIHIFSQRNDYDQSIQQENGNDVIQHYYKSVPLPNLNIGRPRPAEEKVSSILESIMSTFQINSSRIVSISFSKNSKAVPTPLFPSIFNMLSAPHSQPERSTNKTFDVVVLDKTKRLTSMSDWHDLLIIGLSSSMSTSSFLQSFQQVYFDHANRSAFTLLDPRPALLEAIFRSRRRSNLKVSYLTNCEVHTIAETREGTHIRAEKLSRCGSAIRSYIELACGEGSGTHSNHQCGIVEDPMSWKHTIDKNLHVEYSEYARLGKNRWKTDLPEAMFFGSLMFRNATLDNSPRRFCWDSG